MSKCNEQTLLVGPSIRQILGLTILSLFLALHSGCGSKTSPTSTGASDSAGFEDNLVEVPEPEPTPEELWSWLIDAVAQGQSSSISMTAPIRISMLEQLAKAPGAVEVLLDAGVIDDQGMAIIAAHCKEVEHFRARLSPITDEGAKEIAKLSKLRLINLPHGKVAAAGIGAWQQLSQLNHLRLGGKQIDDAALAEIVKLPELQSLHLIGPSLTDDGLQQLIAAKKLSSFYIDDCPFSEAAWAKLKKARPDLHVHVDQVHPDRNQ